jgi:hypothetical protein
MQFGFSIPAGVKDVVEHLFGEIDPLLIAIRSEHYAPEHEALSECFGSG